MIGISVIICCYNSAKRLPETLRHLAQQIVSGFFPWEIIVVNNGSTDNTSSVAETEWVSYNRKEVIFRIINEPKPGLSSARHRGIAESGFEYLIFCDDDNWLASNYLRLIFNTFKFNSKVGAIGGQSFAKFEGAPPGWFSERQHDYAVGKQWPSNAIVNKTKGMIWGAGMGLRKSAYYKLLNLKFKPLLNDRLGTNLSSGGDSELCIALTLAGYDLLIINNLIFHHFIPKARLTVNYNKQLRIGFDEAERQLQNYSYAVKYNKNKLLAAFRLIIKFSLLKRFNAYDQFIKVSLFSNKNKSINAFINNTINQIHD